MVEYTFSTFKCKQNFILPPFALSYRISHTWSCESLCLAPTIHNFKWVKIFVTEQLQIIDSINLLIRRIKNDYSYDLYFKGEKSSFL